MTRAAPGLALAGIGVAFSLGAHRAVADLPPLVLCVALGIALANLARVPAAAAHGLKVAGGVKSVAEAACYLEMADRHLQPSGAEPSNFRFGASGLLNDIVRVLGSVHEAQLSSEY